MDKYTVKIATLILIFIIGIGVGTSYINRKSMEPFRIVESFVNDAIQKKSESIHLIDRASWEQLNKTSMYTYATKELEWDDFVAFINAVETKSITINPKYSFEDKIKSSRQKQVQSDIYTYDINGEENGQISLMMVMVNNEWKVAGIRK